MTDVNTLIENLAKGETSFRYTKADGTVRSAKGTTNLSLVPEAARPQTAQVINENTTTISYYDTTVNGWRSFRKDAVQAEAVA